MHKNPTTNNRKNDARPVSVNSPLSIRLISLTPETFIRIHVQNLIQAGAPEPNLNPSPNYARLGDINEDLRKFSSISSSLACQNRILTAPGTLRHS